jgi:adenylate kinase family enzyme
VLAYYRKQGLLREIEATGDPEAVFEQTRKAIEGIAANVTK